jgi:DNA primase
MRTGVDSGRLEVQKTPEGERNVAVDRVVLPHFMNGKLVGWVARKLEDVPGVPKYRNSKGFPRGSWLYNLDNAKDFDEVYVVESPMSVLVLKSRGVENVVATFGAKVDKQQISLLRNFSKVNIFMDGDTPGRMATEHILEELNNYTKVAIVVTPDDEDPATLMEIPASISSFEYQLKNRLTYSG